MKGGEALIHTIKSYYGDDCPAMIAGVPGEVMRWPLKGAKEINGGMPQFSTVPRDGLEVEGMVPPEREREILANKASADDMLEQAAMLSGGFPPANGVASHNGRNGKPHTPSANGHLPGGGIHKRWKPLSESERSNYLRTQLNPNAVSVLRAPNEYTAAAMAVGFADNTQKTGVVAVTRGPGAMGAIQQLQMADAYQKPVVLLATTGPSSDLEHKAAWQHVRYDEVFRDFAKEVITVRPSWADPAGPNIAEQTMRALELANSGVKGPVVLVLPSDAMNEELGDIGIPKPSKAPPVRPAAPDAVAQAVVTLNRAKKPVIIAGPGTRHCEKAVQKLAEALHAPYCGTYDDQAPRIQHPNYLTDLGYIPAPSARDAILNDSDCVVIVGDKYMGRRQTLEYLALKDQESLAAELASLDAPGASQVERGDRANLARVKDKPIIYIHEEALAAHPTSTPRHQLVGGLPETLEALAAQAFEIPPERAEWTRAEHQKSVDRFHQPFDTAPHVNPAELFRSMSRHLPKDAAVYSDTGGFMTYFGVVDGSEHAVVRGTSECMGLGAGQLIGYALADRLSKHPKPRKYVLVIGDGGMDMNGQNSLKLMKDLGLDVTVVVINNRGDGAIANAAMKLGGTSCSADYGTVQDVAPQDYCKLANGHGIDDAARVYNEADFAKLFSAAMRKPGVKFIEAVTSMRTPALGMVYTGEEARGFGHSDRVTMKAGAQRGI